MDESKAFAWFLDDFLYRIFNRIRFFDQGNRQKTPFLYSALYCTSYNRPIIRWGHISSATGKRLVPICTLSFLRWPQIVGLLITENPKPCQTNLKLFWNLNLKPQTRFKPQVRREALIYCLYPSSTLQPLGKFLHRSPMLSKGRPAARSGWWRWCTASLACHRVWWEEEQQPDSSSWLDRIVNSMGYLRLSE